MRQRNLSGHRKPRLRDLSLGWPLCPLWVIGRRLRSARSRPLFGKITKRPARRRLPKPFRNNPAAGTTGPGATSGWASCARKSQAASDRCKASGTSPTCAPSSPPPESGAGMSSKPWPPRSRPADPATPLLKPRAGANENRNPSRVSARQDQTWAVTKKSGDYIEKSHKRRPGAMARPSMDFAGNDDRLAPVSTRRPSRCKAVLMRSVAVLTLHRPGNPATSASGCASPRRRLLSQRCHCSMLPLMRDVAKGLAASTPAHYGESRLV